MLAHHSPFLQTSLRGAAPHYHPQKPHSVNRKNTSTPGLDAFLYQPNERRARAWRRLISPAPFLLAQLSLPTFNSHLSFPTHFRKGGRKRSREGGWANESGTLACDNCHAEWTSPLFIGFWNAIHCLGREVIKGVEIQTLLSCQLSERNFSPPPPDASVCCGRRLLCAHRHIRIMVSEKCIHSADYLDPAMPLTIVPHRCV